MKGLIYSFLRKFCKRKKEREKRKFIVLTEEDVGRELFVRRTYLLVDDAEERERLERGLMSLLGFLAAKDAVIVIECEGRKDERGERETSSYRSGALQTLRQRART